MRSTDHGPSDRRAGIQFRILNRSKGAAVRGPRAQADRKLYRRAIVALLAETPGLVIVEGAAEDLLLDSRRSGRWPGARRRQAAQSGPGRADHRDVSQRPHSFGGEKISAGRVGEAPSLGLSQTLARCGFALGRLKTGTPPRLDGGTIDWAGLELQPGDDRRRYFRSSPARITMPQVACAYHHTQRRRRTT